MKRLAVMVILVAGVALPATACESLHEARVTLKKWGLSYCLNVYVEDKGLREQAGAARGGYFQRGFHEDDAAYESVRGFFQSKMTSLPVAKGDGSRLPYVACLDLYESKGYGGVIRAQDKFIGD